MSERGVKILVVDDNPATLYATARVLRSAGFIVVEAATGRDALSRAAERPDLVILDVNLPDIDGFQICRELRAMEQTARTPVIHLSATFVKDVDKVQGLEAGADGYLTHPVEPPVLIATVNAFLRARHAEDLMRASEAKFKAVFEQAPNGIALVSDGLIYLEVNPAMCQILGRSREQILGRHLSTFTPIGREQDVPAINAPSEPGETWRGTLPVVRADGEQVELEWAISAYSVPGVQLAIVTDVTERKAIEAERERLLASERAARAEAERANRLKDDFLATLSHELRTPLNAIVGWSHILKCAPVLDAADVREGVDAIERNARVQAQLIEDLLDVSRITSGKLRLDLQPVDPATTLDAALEAVRPAAAAKNITIERELDPAAGPIMWDAARLQQVVWNLVNNAVKFTPRGGRVRVSCERRDSMIEISVQDNGQGIGAAFLPYIFERFRQGDAGTRRGQGGLGLGLAIVKHLVEMHGGTVSAQSPGEGKGATFTVRLPLPAVRPAAGPAAEEVALRPADRVKNAEQTTRLPAVDLRAVRVLVVEDDDDARFLVRRVLMESAAQVMDVADVAAAIEAVSSFKPHVIISDIGMPLQDGFDLIRLVRAQGHTAAALPAIALTAFAREEDRRDALAAGYQQHLSKPVDARELLETVAALASPGAEHGHGRTALAEQ